MSAQPKTLSSLSLIAVSFPNAENLRDLTQFVLTRDEVPHAEIEDNLRQISRRFERFPLKGRTLDLYTNNRIHLLSNKDTVKVPTVLPGWRVAGDRGVVAYVNISQYVPAAGAHSMDVRKLFGFMVFGEVLVDVFDQWAKVANSVQLAKSASVVYARMMHKVVDKLTGVGMDQLRSDQVKFIFAKYFLVNMLGRAANESADTLAQSATRGSAMNALGDFESGVAAQCGATTQKDLYSLGILDFLDALSKSAPWLNRMSGRSFVQNYSSMYGAPALLGAEDAGYFLALVATHQAGAEIIAGFSFDPVYGKEGDDTLDALAALVRT
jgi:hypothetical protein